MIEVGMQAPDFALEEAPGEIVSPGSLVGSWVVLYCYPKDDTKGCTLEALEFSALEEEFARRNAVVLGISPDSCASHEAFRGKHALRVRLLSDPDRTMLETYGVWREKVLYGKRSLGVVRTTFLLDPEGKVLRIWNNVKALGHAEKVLAVLDEFVDSGG